MGFYKSPKSPWGTPKSPSYCIKDIPIQAAAQKPPQIGIMKFLLISEYPTSLPPTQKNSTYPSQAGAIGIILIMRTIFSLDTTKIQPFGCRMFHLPKNYCDMCSHLATLNPLTFSILKKISGSAYPVVILDKIILVVITI